MTFKKMKIRIKNEEHSEVVQEALFALGYHWVYSGKKILDTGACWLYTDEDGNIYFCDEDDGDVLEAVLANNTSFVPVEE